MSTSACDGVHFPHRDSLRPAYISRGVIGWPDVWCITRWTSSRRFAHSRRQEKSKGQLCLILSPLINCVHPPPPSLIALNSNARPITATHPLSTQRIHPLTAPF